MKKLLLFGGSGFVGSHIVNILSKDYVICSFGSECDIRSPAEVKRAIKKCTPDYVIHLASISSIAKSVIDPKKNYEIGFWGTYNILNALMDTNFKGRFLYVSSSEVYGSVLESELPICEKSELRPLNPYSVAKITAESLCYQWSTNKYFDIIIARPFNHIGPGQGIDFSISNFANQIVKIKLGLIPYEIKIGNLEIFKDFTDVRDVVIAYKLLLIYGENGGRYNVCSGIEISIKSILEKMCKIENVSPVFITDLERIRKGENIRIFGNNNKLISLTNWKRNYCIDSTLRDMLQYWKEYYSI